MAIDTVTVSYSKKVLSFLILNIRCENYRILIPFLRIIRLKSYPCGVSVFSYYISVNNDFLLSGL